MFQCQGEGNALAACEGGREGEDDPERFVVFELGSVWFSDVGAVWDIWCCRDYSLTS